MLLPTPIRELLAGSSEEPEILALALQVQQLLSDNKTPFFPYYTDHGAEHTKRVLDAAVRLVPKNVWATELLTSTDAAVLCAGVLLHDIAMHIRELGFAQLIDADTPFRPLPWFKDTRGARPRDLEWHVLWAEFRSEVRHFTSTDLDTILGRGHDGIPLIAYDDRHMNPTQLGANDRLVSGEFLRRHHARLAHEIALYGFPGAQDKFPPLTGGRLHADAIGLVARSHGEPLRTAVDYLEWDCPGSRRPHGAVLPYIMSLLRIADYLQIDASRAPSLLLGLRRPQARTSIDEWNKHGAVASVSWDDQDPLALHVEVGPVHGLNTHQQLRELIQDLQVELDTTSAVLRELYAHGDLAELKISRQRVRTNLLEPSLHERMAYIPLPARLHSGQDLFRLLVSELYGDYPAVGGRELLQNAVDAVRERRRWEAVHGRSVEAQMFRDQDADVHLSIIESDDGPDKLRISDRGVGMTADVVADYFLAAGASFGPPIELLERAGPRNARQWLKAGRFGVGAFAAFLIGAELRVETRHVSQARGISFSTRLDADLIELCWDDVPVGTQVEVSFQLDSLPKPSTTRVTTVAASELLLLEIASYYALIDPSVQLSITTSDGKQRFVHRQGVVPDPDLRFPEWQEVRQQAVDTVLWASGRPKYDEARQVGTTISNIVHNGLEIRHPRARAPMEEYGYIWASTELRETVASPYVAVFDSQHRVGLTLTRYELRTPHLAFERELSYALGIDVLGHALVMGECQYPFGSRYGLTPVLGRSDWFPLSRSFCDLYLPSEACVAVFWHAKGVSHALLDARTLAWHVREAVDGSASLYCLILGVESTDSIPEGEIRALTRTRRIAPKQDREAAGVQSTIDELVRTRKNAAAPAMNKVKWWEDRVSLFVRRGPGHPEDADLEPLAAAWHDALGKPLSRDPVARASDAAELVRNHDRVEACVAKWTARRAECF